ncbi:MAG: diaminopimelate epimerase [Candidatus Micrarchaeota archaeon]|nr:diaminopimelate epimerase [Candidatus Micrarchaeota archaeon]
MREIEFYKYEGTGNDFILIDEFNEVVFKEIEEKRKFAIKYCKRSYGIGSDGVLFLMKNNKGIPLMNMYNPDGSGPDMCGNGIRCVALHALNKRYVKGDKFEIDTNVGIKEISYFKPNYFEVDMGKVYYEPEKLPVITDYPFIEKEIKVDSYTFTATAASIGNPHLIIQVNDEDELTKIDSKLEFIGPKLENYHLFPKRINVHFALVKSDNEIRLLTWERGAGRTKACGTGATTCVAVLNKLGKVKDECTVHVPGGTLFIRKNKKSDTWLMKGNANYVFRGYVYV